MSNALKKLVGKQLLNLSTGREKLTEEFPNGTVLGLFFFKEDRKKEGDGGEGGEKQDFSSPLLIHFLREIKEHKKGICFEVIQIALEDNKSTPKSIQNTPFLAIHGDHSRTIQDYLIRKFGVHTTTLILIDSSSGSVINFQGVENIPKDPKGASFPWRYPKCSDILGSSSGHLITSANGNTNVTHPSSSSTKHQVVNASQLNGFIKGFYFAAYWCPPCRSYLPLLQEVYKKIKSNKSHKFEIIFVSSDRSVNSFNRFFATQPWLAIPFEDSQRRKDLTLMYNIKGIPALVLVDQNDKVITFDARSELVDDCDAVDFPWYPKQVEELRERHTSKLNHELCIIYFTGNDDFDYDKAEDVLSPIAVDYLSSDIEEAKQPNFFIATDSELSESLRIFMELDEHHCYIVAILNARYSVVEESQSQKMTGAQIREFIRKFQASPPELKCKYFPSKFI